MCHEIPEGVPNSTLEFCISEYVRRERNQQILRDHWFKGDSFTALEQKYNISLTAVKKVIYGEGDEVLKRATEMSSFVP